MTVGGGVTLGRGQTFPLHNYKKGARVWHRHPELVWISGVLLEDVGFDTHSINILLDSDEEVTIPLTSVEQLPFLRNPDILIGSDDLTSLSYLHEPAVLHNLQYRFEHRKRVYTYCGIVLVAINPFADCTNLYSDDVIQVFRGVGKQVRGLDPHIYAVAEEAYFDMCEYSKNQSIIVSGESGAGKTVSAKLVMKYLATVAGGKSGKGGIEDRVLASNPILEAIGNAKTTRNDNSSRFGKFIQINFASSFEIGGAEMKTYLLEKSRLVFQAKNERNYHIFYQMCASADHPLLQQFALASSDDYYYTNQGDDAFIEGVDDRKDFTETVSALEVLGFSQQQQTDLLRVIAGILLLGNIYFEGDEMASISRQRNECLGKLCSQLFSIPEGAMRLWLTQREIRAVNEAVRKPLDRAQAVRSRDALSKMLYAHLFSWIVDQINKSLARKDKSKRKVAEQFIGVLDIYGFETFEKNSFEQFCINYANEKLQQQFNQHVFKLEQEEYVREEISWVRIDFYDNQPCIELIEGTPGLICYLDEQCKVVKGSDEGWLQQITNCPVMKKKEHLQMPRIRSDKFMVRHFAADVNYTICGFMEKNKDSVSEQLLEVMSTTKFPFLKEIVGPVAGGNTSTGSGKRLVKKTVAGQFRDSLRELMSVLEATRPHYVRCIKPNDAKESFYYEPHRAIQQLRACGVLETVRISAAGYPSRWGYEDFGKRYRVLYTVEKGALWRTSPKKFAERACTKALEEGKFALGKTKIFFRTGQVALLEQLRHETLSRSATKIQAFYKGYLARKRYEHMRSSLKTIQGSLRAFLAYRRLHYLQMHRAAVTIQTAVRRHQAQQHYQNLRTAVLAIQAAYRANLVRLEYQRLRFEKSALTIQRYWRGYMVRRERVKYIRKVIKVQCCVRRWLAKRRLKELKIEARSVGHLQKLNNGLENKIIELQQRLDVQTAESRMLSHVDVEKKELEVRLAEARRQAQVQAEAATRREAEMKQKIEMLSGQTELLHAERSANTSARQRIEELEHEVERLSVEVDVKDGERSEAENRVNALSSQFEQMRAENERHLAENQEELAALRSKVALLEQDRLKADQQLSAESNKLKKAENELSSMRAQLLANASLLANGAMFSKPPPVQRQDSQKSISVPGPDGKMVTVGGEKGDMDEVALIMKQQQMINELRRKCEQMSRETERLRSVVDSSNLFDTLNRTTSLRTMDLMSHQELELAYQKLKSELERLLEERAMHGVNGMNVQSLIDKLIEENDRRRDESVELRALLSTRFDRQSVIQSSSPRPDSGHWSAAHSDTGTSSDVDEELCLERQCRQLKMHIEYLNRQLAEKNHQMESLEQRLQNEELALFQKSSDMSDHSMRGINDARLKHLVNENLSLNDKMLRQSDELKEARAQLRGFSGSNPGGDVSDCDVSRADPGESPTQHTARLVVNNVPEFSRILICDLKPRVAKLLTPNIPAYLLLAAFRYHESNGDEAGLTALFTTVHMMLKDTVSGSDDMDLLSLWLVSCWRLYNLLRQYGEVENQEWQASNTDVQNSQRILSFDMESMRKQLASRIEECYQNLMKKAIEPQLNPKIVPGVLQHDSAADLGLAHPAVSRQSSGERPPRALDDLLHLLSFVHDKLSAYGADQVLLGQVFGRLVHWICSLALNHMMFRKDLCNFEKAIQIKHNVTEIQSWLSKKGFEAHRNELEPLVQACHLLQSRKDMGNVETLCGEMTSQLKPKQVIAILQHYTPSDGFEELGVDEEVIDRVTDILNERDNDSDTLIRLGTYLPPFDTTPFVYSEMPLESLSLPSTLHLQHVCKLV